MERTSEGRLRAVAAARASAVNEEEAVSELESDGKPSVRLLLELPGVPKV